MTTKNTNTSKTNKVTADNKRVETEKGDKKYITVFCVHLLDRPANDAEIIGTINKGQVVEVTESTNPDYFQVGEGFIEKEYLKEA